MTKQRFWSGLILAIAGTCAVIVVFIRTFTSGKFSPVIGLGGLAAAYGGVYLAKPENFKQIKTPWGIAIFALVAVLVPAVAWYLIRTP